MHLGRLLIVYPPAQLSSDEAVHSEGRGVCEHAGVCVSSEGGCEHAGTQVCVEMALSDSVLNPKP